jgi:hypothetical protein
MALPASSSCPKSVGATIVIFTLDYGRVILQRKLRFRHDGEAECLISLSVVKYLPYDICIRLSGRPNVLFYTFAYFYKITNVKLFDVQSWQPDICIFPI